ncbi:MAG: acyloxyacyl hydrolase [Rhodospirillales bacterium]
MVSKVASIAGFVSALVLWSSGAQSAQMYDMRVFLNQGHPFDRSAQRAPVVQQPTVSQPAVTASAPAAASGQPSIPQTAGAEPMSGGDDIKFNDIVSEIRLGAFLHDTGPFGSSKESGIDGNFEVLFQSPAFLEYIWSPRPHLGVTVNSEGDTSQAYFGLTYEWDIWKGTFGGFSWGGAVHDGKIRTLETDRKELGCRLLFRESFFLGYRFNEHHNVQLHLDHISNAKLCDTNEGLDNFGIRYGYLF